MNDVKINYYKCIDEITIVDDKTYNFNKNSKNVFFSQSLVPDCYTLVYKARALKAKTGYGEKDRYE